MENKKSKAKFAGNSRKCRKCGGNMRLIEGTNVFVCEAFDKKGKPCGQYSIRRVSGFNGEGSPCYQPKKRAKSS